MSLINEALKRARDAQQQAPPPPRSPPPHPAEPAGALGRGLGLLLPVSLAILALLGLLLSWQLARRGVSKPAVEPPAAAAPNTAAQPAPGPEGKSLPPTAGPQVSTNANAVSAPVPAPPETLASTAPPPEPPRAITPPAPLRLQAIVFNPTQPWVMIGGKTLFLGDTISGLRIASITATSVTLVSPDRTNVLRLDP